MLKLKRIKIKEKYVQALAWGLLKKNIILLRGAKGYVMCGYLDLEVAEKFQDVAVRITGVANISEALAARVESCTSFAGKLGIYKGQPVRETLEIIA